MGFKTSAIGGVGLAMSGVLGSREKSDSNEKKNSTTLAYTNSIFQGILPSSSPPTPTPTASAIRA